MAPVRAAPEPQPTLRPEGDYLQQAWARSVYPLAGRLGVEIHLPPVSPQPHTHLAWEGFQFAREHGPRPRTTTASWRRSSVTASTSATGPS